MFDSPGEFASAVRLGHPRTGANSGRDLRIYADLVRGAAGSTAGGAGGEGAAGRGVAALLPDLFDALEEARLSLSPKPHSHTLYPKSFPHTI